MKRLLFLGAGKGDNEERGRWLQRAEGEGYLRHAAPANVGYVQKAPLCREKLGSCRPQGTVELSGGVGGADSLRNPSVTAE